MNSQKAAQELLTLLKAPGGVITVWPWHGDDKVKLIVKIDKAYKGDLANKPNSFQGYEVVYEYREPTIVEVL